jgi:hypothetical protein
MNESAAELKNQMLMVADQLRKLECLNRSVPEISQLLFAMQEGGEPASEAWVALLRETVRLPLEERVRAQALLSDFRQAIGRWHNAETRAKLSTSPFPHTRAP